MLSRGANGLTHQFNRRDGFDHDGRGAGVAARNFEQVFDEDWNTARSPTSRSRLCWATGERSPRCWESTVAVVASVVKGERNSWLTSLANRASRSSRSTNWLTMALKDSVSCWTSRSVLPVTRRVVSSPPAINAAAADTVQVGARSFSLPRVLRRFR